MVYQREAFEIPDGDFLFLDWARCGQSTKDLLIVSHGLCGHTQRHYIVSLIRSFQAMGVDCLAWNFRLTGQCPNRLLKMTTSNSTDELDWITRHAIAKGGYHRVFHAGYSMGGNISLLYLSREADHIPVEVAGGVAFCATIDIPVCTRLLDSTAGKVYTKYFLKKLMRGLQEKHKQYPDKIDLASLAQIRNFRDFDDRFTAPLMGFKNAEDYWRKASACSWLKNLKVPTLLVNPENDPFLGGDCYPVELARKSKALYLEIPQEGGHCGFITQKGHEWWPAFRAKEFFREVVSNRC
ncbi:MAG: alpha/beta fold hydrolase [Lentisphaeria bacterium]